MGVGKPRSTVVDPLGRRKAFRPLPPEGRAAALRAGLDAYQRGDFFEAHEVLEPAWMGTDDAAERDLYQGLIKLAAAYVHAVRGNQAGWAKNLHGARERLERAVSAGSLAGIDVAAIVTAIEHELDTPEPSPHTGAPIPIPRRGRSSRSSAASTRR